MVVNFAEVDVREKPVVILRNLNGTPLGVLGSAFNVELDLCYNELSTLKFDLPAFLDGEQTPLYDMVVGMRVIELKDYGQFMLVDPETEDDGVKQIKSCTAYSLEYEFTFKRMPLDAGTYNFYNPYARNGTILQKILDVMPSWGLGTIDASLYDKYRTFDGNGDQNLYNLIKSDFQESFGCIFDFDTFSREINVRDITREATITPVYFSMDNLVKKVEIKEDTEHIVTKLGVTGADNVDIRGVNPTGTNSLINLDYFMTSENFSESVINKYNGWKAKFAEKQEPYFYLTVEEALKVAQLTTEQADLVTLQGELADLENLKAVAFQAKELKTSPPQGYTLEEVNVKLRDKQNEITKKESAIARIQGALKTLNAEMIQINQYTNFETSFTPDEYKIVNRYLKEDAIREDSFVSPNVDTFDAENECVNLQNTEFYINRAIITRTTKQENRNSKYIYSISGGQLVCSKPGFYLTSNMTRASISYVPGGEFLFTASLSDGELNTAQNASDTSKKKGFMSACLSISGLGGVSDLGIVPDESVNSVIYEGSKIGFTAADARVFFTRSKTEYERRAVEWDLFDYGKKFLQKLAFPSYSFSLDLANFLVMKEFEPFKQNLEIGSKLYWKQRGGKTLEPILIGVHIPFEDLKKFSVELSSKYNSASGEFDFEDLIEDSKTAGATLDTGRWTYNQFVNSGAETSISKFMKNALDIAKNNIISSSGQAITWDETGFRLRKKSESSTETYEKFQIWMNNASIMFTDDNWDNANLAIGRIATDEQDGNGQPVIKSGVIADQLIGHIVAAESLIIESDATDGGKDKDGKRLGNPLFRVDSSGASLINAKFDISNSKTQITLNPEVGIAIGQKIYNDNNEFEKNNTVFYVDTDGNLNFEGRLSAKSGDIGGFTIFKNLLYSESGTKYVGISGSRNDNYAFWAGNATPSKANFSVTNDGKLTSKSGEIGGFTIDGEKLYSKGSDKSNDYIGIGGKGSGDYAFWAGNETALSANFYVKKNGTLHAENGDFESCNITKGKITSATIDKGTFSGEAKGELIGPAIYVPNKDNPAFYVSSTGDVILKGKINMAEGDLTLKAGSIKFGDLAPSITGDISNANTAASEAKKAADAAKTAADNAQEMAKKIANGEYEGTFIDGDKIYSPEIYAGKNEKVIALTSNGMDIYSGKNSRHTLHIGANDKTAVMNTGAYITSMKISTNMLDLQTVSIISLNSNVIIEGLADRLHLTYGP